MKQSEQKTYPIVEWNGSRWIWNIGPHAKFAVVCAILDPNEYAKENGIVPDDKN